MTRVLAWGCCALLCVACKSESFGTGLPEPIVHELKLDPSQVDSEAIRIAHQASSEGKRVLVYFHADWCGPCQELKHAFSRSTNRATFSNWYLVKVNVDEMKGDRALGLNIEYIPFMVKLDANGKAAGTLDGEAFGVDPQPDHVDEIFRNFLRS